MSDGHAHAAAGAGHSAGGRYRSRLAWALALIVVFFAVELTAGLVTGSLALLSDAGHMLTDIVGVGMALAAITAAASGSRHSQHSFGLYRLEILAALVNAVLLLGVAGYVLIEAVGRVRDPVTVAAGPMLVVGTAGLAVNLVAFALLHRGAQESLNLRGALLEVAFDALNSVGVVVAGIVLITTGWPYADPLFAAGIGLAIIPRAWGLGRQALRVLLQAAPEHVAVADVCDDLAGLAGVVDVHDVHVWTLTSGMEVASAHLMVDTDTDGHAVLDQARDLLVERYHIDHATLQVEPCNHQGCEEMVW